MFVRVCVLQRDGAGALAGGVDATEPCSVAGGPRLCHWVGIVYAAIEICSV